VQISGTEAMACACVRRGLEGVVRFLAIESEVFQVTDGPREVDGYTWWYLTAPSDGTVQGWAVANYLAVIQNP
jgi:hypothetical protein